MEDKGLVLSKQALGSAKWKRTRLAVLARDGMQCAYCGKEADQVDHVVSRVSGGDMFDMDNLVAACRLCNQKKSSKSVKSLFFRSGSTPPVFPERSLPETVAVKPESPFEKP